MPNFRLGTKESFTRFQRLGKPDEWDLWQKGRAQCANYKNGNQCQSNKTQEERPSKSRGSCNYMLLTTMSASRVALAFSNEF